MSEWTNVNGVIFVYFQYWQCAGLQRLCLQTRRFHPRGTNSTEQYYYWVSFFTFKDHSLQRTIIVKPSSCTFLSHAAGLQDFEAFQNVPVFLGCSGNVWEFALGGSYEKTTIRFSLSTSVSDTATSASECLTVQRRREREFFPYCLSPSCCITC